jgi:hypothetical protein
MTRSSKYPTIGWLYSNTATGSFLLISSVHTVYIPTDIRQILHPQPAVACMATAHCARWCQEARNTQFNLVCYSRLDHHEPSTQLPGFTNLILLLTLGSTFNFLAKSVQRFLSLKNGNGYVYYMI